MANDKTEIGGRNGTLCPYLGFCDDPETALSYPSQHNCCYHAKPVAIVNLNQQRQHCLNGKYSVCPVYLKEKIGPLPKELRARYPGGSKPRPWLPIVLLISVLILGFIAGNLFGIIRILGLEGMLVYVPSTQIPTMIVPSATIETPLPSATPTRAVKPTVTIMVVSPTAISPHLLETLIGVSPQLVIHRIIEGEGFILLTETYNTSEEAIRAVNFKMPEFLFVDKILIIPVNTSDVTGLPSFSAYEVEKDGVTIEELAKFLLLNANLLKKYNALPAGYVFDKGEWVLIPH